MKRTHVGHCVTRSRVAGVCAARGVGVGVAGQTGKASEGFYSNWERLAFYGQGNDARNCKGRRVGWSGGEKMRGVPQMRGLG